MRMEKSKIKAGVFFGNILKLFRKGNNTTIIYFPLYLNYLKEKIFYF
jgi:hypothetical protein